MEEPATAEVKKGTEEEGQSAEGVGKVRPLSADVPADKQWTLVDRSAFSGLRLTLKRAHSPEGGSRSRKLKTQMLPLLTFDPFQLPPLPPPSSPPTPSTPLPPSHPPPPVDDRSSYKASATWEKARARAVLRKAQRTAAKCDASLPPDASAPPSHTSPAGKGGGRRVRGAAEDSDAEMLASAARHSAALSLIPSAPILTPSPAEFADPMRYIRSVVKAHEAHGVVVVQPPAGWRPSYEYRLEGEEGFACKRQLVKRYTERQRRKHRERERKLKKRGGVEPLPDLPPTHLDRTAMQVSAFPFSTSMTLDQFMREAATKQADWDALYLRWQAKVSRASPSPPLPYPLAPAEDAYWRWAMYYGRQLPSVFYANDVDTTPAHRTPLPPSSPSPSPSIPSPLTSPAPHPPAGAPFHPWELSTFNLLPSGILHHLDRVIPGITAPMLYIGMQFSTFCWHHEDHHLYSISYNHRGAAKTWYGVPGSHCQAVERIARDHLYPFFDHDRDHILARKTSMFSPTLLAERGVPVYRAEQGEGMFVITFPRAYHSGFSHGFSLAESVNFALDDWFEAGYEATAMYRKLARFPVVPYAELMMRVVEGAMEGRAGEHADDLTLFSRLERCVALLVWDELRERDRMYGGARHARLKLTHQMGRKRTTYCDQCSHAAYFSVLRCGCEGGSELCLAGHGLCRVHRQEGSTVTLAYSSLELTTIISAVQERMAAVRARRVGEGAMKEEDEREARVRNGRFDACLALATALSDREAMAEEVHEEDQEEEEGREEVVEVDHRRAQSSGPPSALREVPAVPITSRAEMPVAPSPASTPPPPPLPASSPSAHPTPHAPQSDGATSPRCPARNQKMLAFLLAELENDLMRDSDSDSNSSLSPSPLTPSSTQVLA